MSSAATTSPSSKALVWVGRILSGLLVLMLAFSAYGKFVPSTDLDKGFEHLGWPIKLAMALGILEIVCTLLYAIPQTAMLGAILLTGYMGGAIAAHVRVGDNFVMQASIGVVVWLALFLRDQRLRALIPCRS